MTWKHCSLFPHWIFLDFQYETMSLCMTVSSWENCWATERREEKAKQLHRPIHLRQLIKIRIHLIGFERLLCNQLITVLVSASKWKSTLSIILFIFNFVFRDFLHVALFPLDKSICVWISVCLAFAHFAHNAQTSSAITIYWRKNVYVYSAVLVYVCMCIDVSVNHLTTIRWLCAWCACSRI